MLVKRERELSPTDQPTNKAKTKPTTPKRSRASSSSTTPSVSPASTALSKEDKARLVRCAMDHVYKTMNFVEIAAEMGVNVTQLKDQFKPNRSNVRIVIEQTFDK